MSKEMNESDNDKAKKYVIERGGSEKKLYDKDEVRGIVQNVIANSVNLSALIGSGASTPAISLMGDTFNDYRDELKKKSNMSYFLEDLVKNICKNHSEYEDDKEHKFNVIDPILSLLKSKVNNNYQQLLDDIQIKVVGSEKNKNSILENFTSYRNDLKKDADISEFFEKLIKKICKKHPEYKEEEFNDIEFFLSWLQYRIDGDADDSGKCQKLFNDVKTKFINSVKNVNKDSVEEVENNYLKVIQGLGKSRQILARQQKTVFDIVNLFTTNYDLFHERALELSHYAYTDGFTNGINNTFSDREFHRRPIDLEDRFKDKLQPVNPFFRLLKLHGSINWEKKENKVIRVSNGNINNESNNDLKRVLISPTSSKFALTQDEPYSDLFREFVNIMAIPNSVLFTSAFSFNDSHIANLIENALDRTDFTLYAFIGDHNNDDSESNFSKFIKRISKSPNVFLIYIDGKSYVPFGDFAYFMQPDVINNVEKNDEKKGENDD